MLPYLDSLRTHADFPVYLVGVGFEPPQIPGVCGISIDREQNAGAPDETESIQHGSFTGVIRHKVSEVVVYTDGDFIMQRPMDDGERRLLKLKHGQVVTSWNGGPHETLLTEAGRLWQRASSAEMSRLWGEDWHTRPIYNVGFLAMTYRTWIELYKSYMKRWPDACSCFAHKARQQWLISYLLSDYEVTVAPWHLHAHGHFGLQSGMERRPDGIYADGKKALFRHYL
jgi:hypothetical protein